MSAKRIWKCYGCCQIKGVDFVSADPKCPKCGLDGADKSNPEHHMIAPVVVIHFMPPLSKRLFGLKGTGKLACQPGKGVGGVMATGDPRETNCPLCKLSPEYMQYKAPDVDPLYAVPDVADGILEPVNKG